MIDRDEYAVRLMDLPEGVGGFITESPDGFLNIYINARYGRAGQHKAFLHELRHAEGDDLRSAEPLALIEARADGADVRLKAIPHLMRARDLIPGGPPADPPAVEEPAARPAAVSLTPRQRAAIRHALADLDSFILPDLYAY